MEYIDFNYTTWGDDVLVNARDWQKVLKFLRAHGLTVIKGKPGETLPKFDPEKYGKSNPGGRPPTRKL